MPPKGSKRPAAAAGRAAKKSRGLESECSAVIDALRTAEQLPETVRETLASAAPFALSGYVEDRHPHQVSVLGMIEGALTDIQAVLFKEVEDIKAKLEARDAEKAKREAAVLTSAKTIATSKALAAEKEYENYAASVALKKAEQAFKEAEKAQKAGDKAYTALFAKKEELDAIKAKVVTMKAGSCPKKDVAILEKEMAPFDFDATLIAHMHLCLTKAPEELSEFEKKMINELDAELAERSTQVEAQLAQEEPGKTSRGETVATASAAATAAKEALAAAKEALSEAESNVETAEIDLGEREAAVKNFDVDMKAAEVALKSATHAHTEFVDVTVHTFNNLKSRATPPPEPVLPEPEATTGEGGDAPAAEAPAAEAPAAEDPAGTAEC